MILGSNRRTEQMGKEQRRGKCGKGSEEKISQRRSRGRDNLVGKEQRKV